jgi:hypothetical protein
MKPSISILDQSFRYVPSIETSVADTWRRFGWRPASAAERDDRRRKASSKRADHAGLAATRSGTDASTRHARSLAEVA